MQASPRGYLPRWALTSSHRRSCWPPQNRASIDSVVGASRPIATLDMVLRFVVIMMLIADLDRPLEGLRRVNHQSMVGPHQSIQ